jgi:hypothetical protein
MRVHTVAKAPLDDFRDSLSLRFQGWCSFNQFAILAAPGNGARLGTTITFLAGQHTELNLAQGRRAEALRRKPKKGFLARETPEMA